jgi:hypothetical protein
MSHPDLQTLAEIFPYILKYQNLATKHGIQDIFQDNGGKLLQLILALNLKVLPGRTGNDAYCEISQYEIKTLNIELTQSFSTHHHLNKKILEKYRNANWIFAIFDNIILQKVYKVKPEDLEIYFSKWDSLLEDCDHKNNPKIALKHVQEVGTVVWPVND